MLLTPTPERASSQPSWTANLSRFFSGRWAPLFAGILSGACVLFVWGSLNAPPATNDEQAYVLQARIFATGQWTTPSPAFPHLFERMHAFTEPAVFAKYPPGHALVLVPGVWLGFSGLVPIALTMISGALFFVLVREFTAPSAAWFAVLSWATLPANVMWRSSYFSELTTGALWLFVCWALYRWWVTRRAMLLMYVSASMTLCMLTRPLTAAALSVPLAVVIVSRLRTTVGLGRATLALLLPPLLLALWPYWNHQTLGSWRLDPYSEYSRLYFPFDKPGFGVDQTPPVKVVSAPLQWIGNENARVHVGYDMRSLPKAFVSRITTFVSWNATGWRLPIFALFVLGLARRQGAKDFALLSMLATFAAYLSFAHDPNWTLYYLELFPVIYFTVALTLASIWSADGKTSSKTAARNRALAVPMVTAVLIPLFASDLLAGRETMRIRQSFQENTRAALARVQFPAIVLVNYPPSHRYHSMAVTEGPDLGSSPVWVITDGEAGIDQLIATNPSRSVYRLHVDGYRLERLRLAGSPDERSRQ